MSIKLFKIILSSPYELVKYDWEHKLQFPNSTSNSHHDQSYLHNIFLLHLYLISYQRQFTFIGIFLLFNTFGDLFVLLKVIMGFE